MSSASKKCRHQILQLEPSPFAELAGYTQPSFQERTKATTRFVRETQASVKTKDSIGTFPAPLVLPFDDLNYDPDCESQDFKTWLQFKTRNKVTTSRQTVYLARVPEITEAVAYMKDWTIPSKCQSNSAEAQSPNIETFIDYTSAFYHGLPVKELPTRLKWTSWEARTPTRTTSIPKYIALQHGNGTTRIRTRIPPDTAFPAQLNLDDILDALIRALPRDAHSLLLLVDHDIWEADDDFCCGRAYGGSRVAVVQTARYRPGLDADEGVDRTHMWPLSHCKTFVDDLCSAEDVVPRKATRLQVVRSRAGPMRSAVDAAVRKMDGLDVAGDMDALWFSRLARTVSHELGHCFAFAHCVFHACNLQGTAGMKEDVRQPPYLCPVCESKLSHAVVVERLRGGEEERKMWVKERCGSLREFCQRLEEDGKGTAMWSGLDAWLGERMLSL
ncbi:hypothetical protein M3J07_013298 [Ascochyta lentis]